MIFLLMCLKTHSSFWLIIPSSLEMMLNSQGGVLWPGLCYGSRVIGSHPQWLIQIRANQSCCFYSLTRTGKDRANCTIYETQMLLLLVIFLSLFEPPQQLFTLVSICLRPLGHNKKNLTHREELRGKSWRGSRLKFWLIPKLNCITVIPIISLFIPFLPLFRMSQNPSNEFLFVFS